LLLNTDSITEQLRTCLLTRVAKICLRSRSTQYAELKDQWNEYSYNLTLDTNRKSIYPPKANNNLPD